MKKVIYQGKNFDIVTETTRKYKSARTVEYFKRPSSVIVLVVSKDDKILLLKENRRERGGYVWGLVSGHIEKNEEKNPVIAAKRELNEEAGLIANKIELFFVSEPSSSIKWKRYVYIVEDFKKSDISAEKDKDEQIGIFYLPFDKALTMSINGEIKNETAALAIIRYLSKKRRLLSL